MADYSNDALIIRDLVDKWVIYSDAGDWDRFAMLWHADGWMSATWFQAPAANFVKARREGWERGVSITHFLGAHTADIIGNRAVAQTKMTISQRAPVHGVLCDVVCTGRFYDFLEKREGSGDSCEGNPSMRRTGWIPWIQKHPSNWTRHS
jgi:hypothetical protein